MPDTQTKMTQSPAEKTMESFRMNTFDAVTVMNRSATSQITLLLLDLELNWNDFPKTFQDEVRQLLMVDDSDPKKVRIYSL
jgi:hypothetical protein